MERCDQTIGYHCNDQQRCSDFVNQLIMIYSEDRDFLGYGMYFWDNRGNANYWLEEKKRKHPTVNEWNIVSAAICLNMLLDLTDTDELKRFDDLHREYCKRTRKSTSQPLGKKLDDVFNFFSLDEHYNVVKASVPYKNMYHPGFLVNTRIGNVSRILYSVKSELPIASPRLEL